MRRGATDVPEMLRRFKLTQQTQFGIRNRPLSQDTKISNMEDDHVT